MAAQRTAAVDAPALRHLRAIPAGPGPPRPRRERSKRLYRTRDRGAQDTTDARGRVVLDLAPTVGSRLGPLLLKERHGKYPACSSTSSWD